jgi:serine/threonine protein kinase
MGTAYYMAPEQIQGDPSIDHRADVYAMDVVVRGGARLLLDQSLRGG